jgi:predicted ATP-grasp superfamily ATP-dependent carboligase
VTDGSDGGPRSGERAAVLVTDGEQRAALAVVRSLGRAGYRVHVSARRRRALAAASRWASSVLEAPDPLREGEAFVNAVAAHVAAHDIAVVVPVTDASMLALLSARDRLGSATIPFGSLEAFLALADKAGLRDRAVRLGIAFPAQRALEWSERSMALAGCVRMPAVVKPARSVAGVGAGRAKFGVEHAATIDALERVVRSIPQAGYPLLIQERIVGPGIGVFLLLWDGRIVASFAHRRLREKPPSGGVSVSAESIAGTPELIDRSRALLTEIGWSGVAMVEYKVDQETGTPYLMEINGRFWGSLQLAIDAGVDFPALLVACALGQVPAAAPDYRVGLRGRWWWGDVDHLIARLRHSSTGLSLPPGAPSRAAAVGDFVSACVRGDPDAVWRWSDPRPFLAETASWLRRQ